MILQLRRHLERHVGLPFHFVTITEDEARPCGTVRKSAVERQQPLSLKTAPRSSRGSRVAGVEVILFADDYERLDEISEGVVEDYNGAVIDLPEVGTATILIDDEDDEAYPAGDGSDNYIYSRTLNFRVHHRQG